MSDSGDRNESGGQANVPPNPSAGQQNPHWGAPQPHPYSGPPNYFAAPPNQYAQPNPYGGQFAQPYGYPAGQHPQQFHTPAPRRSSKKPIIIAALAILSVFAVGITAVVVFASDIGRSTPERQARSSLATAQVGLLHTPAVRYVGTVTGTALGSPTLNVDLIVSNVGDATGTVSVGNAQLDYLGVGGKSFLEGDENGWRALGVTADVVGSYTGRPIMIGPDLFGVDLATTLAPARLALALDPDAVRDKQVGIGTSMYIGGHESTPVTSGGLTTYLRGLHEDGTTAETGQIIARIISDESFGSSQSDLPSLTLDTEYLASATTLYSELPGRIDKLNKAVDSRVSVDGTLNGRFLENPCMGVCTIEFTIRNTVKSTSDIRVTTLSYDHTITVESTVAITTSPNCAGSGTMAPNGSATIRCTATYDPYQIPAGTTVPINAYAQVSVRALNPEQVSALKTQIQGNQSSTPTTGATIDDDWNAYTASGGTLTKEAWTTERTALNDRSTG
ncbi:DUF3824 domain-containing protein [Nocardia sp. NPDC058666]|uniref:DUF3824 domain-containing protein n=1 Tax=Nocardia sp. NPDC058666 TaxID=3346587 RepID=UPI00364F56D2